MCYIFIVVGIVLLVGAIAKYIRSRELSGKLGREIGDHELVSLNSWMEAEKNVDRQAAQPVNQRACPSCGKPLAPDAKFCSNCGMQFS